MEQQNSETPKSFFDPQSTSDPFTIAVIVAVFVSAGLPCILGLFLFMLNSEYIGRMIFTCESRGISGDLCSQPCGWIMVFTVITTTLLSLRISKSFFLQKKIWRFVLNVSMSLFLTLLAVLIVLLGPAVLIIMETNF
jgi:hypothetical protein